MSVLVILPTYNERENLPLTVGRVLTANPSVEVLVVDDGSPDGTGAVADALASDDARVHVLHRTSKDGLGAAYLAGFAWALEREFEVVVECDADGSHQPEQLPDLLAALADHDVAVGSRWIEGSHVVHWPLARRLLSRAGSFYARRMLRLSQHDITGGYRAFRAAGLRMMDLPSIVSQGYCFQIEMLWRADLAGLRIVEVPITFVDRELGASKMRWNITAEALSRVTRWGLALRLGRRVPQLVQVP